MTKQIIHVEEDEQDKKYLNKFQEELDMLYNMVIEMFETNQIYLLSPVMRKMMREKAKVVKNLHGPLKNILHVDNLRDTPLTPWTLD